MFDKRVLLVSMGLVCLSHRSAIAVTEPPPQFLTMWGSYGSGPGQFVAPWGLAVDAAGYVYVADQYNHRICKFTDAGQFVRAWGSYGSGPGQFNQPGGIGADATGRIFVADYGNNRIEVFTSEGAFLNVFGSGGTGPGQLLHPYDVAVGPSGTVYVADHDNNRIAEYDGNGLFITALATNRTTGVVVDVSGNIFVSSEGGPGDTGNFVTKYDPAGNLLLRLGSPGSASGLFDGPAGLAIDGAGDLYVADFGNNRVQKFSPNGLLLSYWGTPGTGAGQFSGTLDVGIGPDGAIYVSDAGNHRVQKFGFALTPAQSVTWGSMKVRYRGATPPAPRGR
jgi:tripartite motif-containing protein 71